MSSGTTFDQAFRVVVGHEGGYSRDPRDTGNWTGGAVGKGMLLGTQWGISAAAYPALDIASLKAADAKRLYRRDYWDRVGGDALPPALALLVFDAAVNTGVGRAARWLQGAVGAAADGIIGPATLAAVRATILVETCTEFSARRMLFMAGLPNWRVFGPGWSRRLSRLPYQAMGMR